MTMTGGLRTAAAHAFGFGVAAAFRQWTARPLLWAFAMLLAVPGQTEPAEPGEVSAGACHTVLLTRGGTVWSWGYGRPGWAPSQVDGPDQNSTAKFSNCFLLNTL